MKQAFRLDEVVRLTGLSASQIKTLARRRIVPSGRDKDGPFWGFRELRALRRIKAFLDQGMDLERLIRGLRRLDPEDLPRLELRGRRLLLRRGDVLLEPGGQLCLDFSPLCPQTLDLSPTTAEGWFYLGLSREAQGDQSGALLAYQKALELDPQHADSLVNLGNLHYQEGDLSQAKERYFEALMIEPDHPEASFNLGCLLMEEAEPAMAAVFFRRVVEKDPEFSDAYFCLGEALLLIDRTREARIWLKRYLSVDPQGPYAPLARKLLKGGSP
ncbi:MAG TPA: tetratricopeptide repeat protein [Thermodesulfatator sp.]|nr:tetratricopeptide repeat protein [Thermodesulfatator sp.]